MNQVKTNNYLRKRLGTHEARITKLQVKLQEMEKKVIAVNGRVNELQREYDILFYKYKLHLRDLHNGLRW